MNSQWAAHPLGWLDPEPRSGTTVNKYLSNFSLQAFVPNCAMMPRACSSATLAVTHMRKDLLKRQAAEEMHFQVRTLAITLICLLLAYSIAPLQVATALEFLRAHQHGGSFGAAPPQRKTKNSGALLVTALMDESASTVTRGSACHTCITVAWIARLNTPPPILHTQALPTLMTLPYVDPNQIFEVSVRLLSSPVLPRLTCIASCRCLVTDRISCCLRPSRRARPMWCGGSSRNQAWISIGKDCSTAVSVSFLFPSVGLNSARLCSS